MDRRTLLIGLDGFEVSYAEELMKQGELPALSALRDRSAIFHLDHGSAQYTGLAWEHVASGLSPEDARRWSAVEFDPKTYQIRQEGARFVPWMDSLRGLETVVFDTPYVDMRRTQHLQGVVGWGAHDPGTCLAARPHSLLEKFKKRVGNYPSPEWIYDCPAYSPDRSRQMGEALVEALRVRSQATLWLMSDPFPDWEVFFVVTGELHSAIEGLWHGVDPQHPLHHHASGPVAAEALKQVYRATDQMVAELVEAAGEGDVVALSTGGMGSNQSDLQSMVLLPEFLHQRAFQKPLLQVPSTWSAQPQTVPLLTEQEHHNWHYATGNWFPSEPQVTRNSIHWSQRLLRPITRILQPGQALQPFNNPLNWQPASQYQSRWSLMPAFALPSFYDGRIRINLKGREQQGQVSLANYEVFCSELEDSLRQLQDPRTGHPAVASVERHGLRDPLHLDNSDADLIVIWQGTSTAFYHPGYGQIGPVPFRRTGGHTGPYGVVFLSGPGLVQGYHGVRSTFDVVPTVLDRLGVENGPRVSGTSFLSTSLGELSGHPCILDTK